MATIVYGWGNVLKKKQIMGYQWCPSCGSFKPEYLSKLVFRVHISYIPIFKKTKGYFIACPGCEKGREITKEQFKELKEKFKPMTNSLSKKCFKELTQVCATCTECSETTVQGIFYQMAQKYPISATEELTAEYRQLIIDLIGERLERERMMLQQQQMMLQQNQM